MKKDKKKLKEAFFEGLLEIVLTLIFLGIGALIVSVFGVELDSPNIDFDLIVLLGVFCSYCCFWTYMHISSMAQENNQR